MAKALLRLPEVLKRVPVSRAQLYLMIQRGEFPPPVKLSARASAWPEDAVDAWIDEKSESRGTNDG